MKMKLEMVEKDFFGRVCIISNVMEMLGKDMVE